MKLAFHFIFTTFLLRKDSVYELESSVRGHPAYGCIWSATVDEQLECKNTLLLSRAAPTIFAAAYCWGLG